MGYVKNKMLDVEEMYREGIAPYEIANRTGCNIEEVIHILDMKGLIFDDSDYDCSIDQLAKMIAEYTA